MIQVHLCYYVIFRMFNDKKTVLVTASVGVIALVIGVIIGHFSSKTQSPTPNDNKDDKGRTSSEQEIIKY